MISQSQKKHTLFIYGLPKIGKSQELLKIYQQDHGNDLVISLNGHRQTKHVAYTNSYVRVRNRHNIPALGVARNNQNFQLGDLKAFFMMHNNIKHILIDEAEDDNTSQMKLLLTDLHRVFPFTSVILFGVLLDNKNREFKASRYLINNYQSYNYNPLCKFCNRQAQYMINLYQGQFVTYQWIDRQSKAKQKLIKKHLKRYHVCAYHYNHYHEALKLLRLRGGNQS